MRWVGVDDDDLGGVTVEVGEVLSSQCESTQSGSEEVTHLDVLAVLEACGLAEQRPHDEAEGVELADDGVGVHGLDRGEDDELILGAEVAQEVVETRALRQAVAVLGAPLRVQQQILERQDEGQLGGATGDLVLVGQQLLEGRFGVVGLLAVDAGGGAGVHQAGGPVVGDVCVCLGLVLALPRAAHVGSTHRTEQERCEVAPVGDTVPPPVGAGLVGRLGQLAAASATVRGVLGLFGAGIGVVGVALRLAVSLLLSGEGRGDAKAQVGQRLLGLLRLCVGSLGGGICVLSGRLGA